MEVHFVHVRSDLSVLDALSKKDGLAIVAVFCKVSLISGLLRLYCLVYAPLPKMQVAGKILFLQSIVFTWR